MMAGYMQSTGDCIINISADMQDPPELMNEMIAGFFNEGIQIVVCTRQDREDNLFRKVTSQLFYRLIRKLSFRNMPLGGFDYALISRYVRDIIMKEYDANPFWQGQLLWAGFTVKFIPYIRREREIGKSRWTFRKRMKYLIDGVLGYSYWPLRAMSVSGIVIFIMGLLYAFYIVLNYFFGNVPFKGWAPIMILILVLSGIQMLMIGILGEYLWRTLDQVRKRPMYIIEKICSGNEESKEKI
jgi:dolichol-phosphate mannosyltransferase